MRNFENDFEKFHINLQDLPKYDNPNSFANSFKKCSLYEYGNISYSNSSSQLLNFNNEKK